MVKNFIWLSLYDLHSIGFNPKITISVYDKCHEENMGLQGAQRWDVQI